MTKLEFHRRTQRLTQADLASLAGCSPSSIANLERGHWSRPSTRFLENLAEALGIDRDEALELVRTAEIPHRLVSSVA